jgi:hypothetical protein
MRPPRALLAAHFERNDIIIICETVHSPAIYRFSETLVKFILLAAIERLRI